MKTYGPFTLNSFTHGDRVEIGPHLDLWMRGARYGQITGVGRAKISIKMDCGRMVRLAPDDIFAII